MKLLLFLPALLLAAPTLAYDNLLELRGQVSDARTGAPLPATVHYQMVPENDNVGQFAPAADGTFALFLATGHTYAVEVVAPGYVPLHARVEAGQAGRVEQRYVLEPAAAVVTAAYPQGAPGVHFGRNAYALPEGDQPTLDALSERLRTDADLRVLVEGHVEGGGSPRYSQELAARRAHAVADYLRRRGTSKRRMVTQVVGKGRTLVISNDSATLGMNRRVELRVVDKHDWAYRTTRPFFRWRVRAGLCSRRLYREALRQSYFGPKQPAPVRQIIYVDPAAASRSTLVPAR